MSRRQPQIRINEFQIALDEISEFVIDPPHDTRTPAECASALKLIGGRIIPLAPREAQRVLDFVRQNEE